MQLNSEMLEFNIGNLKIIEKMPELLTDEPFSLERIAFLDSISKRILSDKNAKVYPDVITFAFWIRKANMERKKLEFVSDNRMRMGKGIVFHIAPSNVAVNYAYSFAVGFVLGNANIVRLPSRNYHQVSIINQAIEKTLEEDKSFQKWRNYLVFLRYTRNKEINDFFSSICDVRVIWGGDVSIQEIRQSQLQPRSSEITFADRYSICIIEAEIYLNTADKNKIALDFYNDTYLTDQNACTAPKLVCWMGKEDLVCRAKEIFWENLQELVERKYLFQPIQYINKLVYGCIAAIKTDVISITQMKDNSITRLELKGINAELQDYGGNSGFFYEYYLKDIMELMPLCNKKLQTISFLGNIDILYPLIHSGRKGIDRIVRIGQTMDFDFIWDGNNLTDYMTRIIKEGYGLQ